MLLGWFLFLRKDFMKTRIIQTRFWDDEFISSCSLEAKVVFLYLITNDSIGMTGVYEKPVKYVGFYTGLTPQKVEKALKELENKIIYSKGWFIVLNAIKYNNYASNTKQRMAYMKEWDKIPTHLQHYVPYFEDVEEYAPEYKTGNKSSYKHREIAEQVLDRQLEENEVVHHLDRNPSNNSIDNLAVVDKQIHINIHNGSIKEIDTTMILLSDYYDTRPNTEIRNKNIEIRNKNIEIRNKNTENRIQKEEIEGVKIEKVEYGFFNDLTDEVIQEIAEFYKVPFEFVSERREDMDIWMGKDPRKNKYKNYKQALQKWVRDSRQKLISNNLKDRNNAKSKFAKMG